MQTLTMKNILDGVENGLLQDCREAEGMGGGNCSYLYDNGKRCIVGCGMDNETLEKVMSNENPDGSNLNGTNFSELVDNVVKVKDGEKGDIVALQGKFDDFMKRSVHYHVGDMEKLLNRMRTKYEYV